MLNLEKNRFWWRFMLLVLLSVSLVLAAFFAGAYWKILQFRENFEQIADLNQCNRICISIFCKLI